MSPDDGSSWRPRHAADDHQRHPFTQSLLWTAIGTIVPGLGFWPTRLRRVGLSIIAAGVTAIVFVAARVPPAPFLRLALVPGRGSGRPQPLGDATSHGRAAQATCSGRPDASSSAG